jgi:hypothetical protein
MQNSEWYNLELHSFPMHMNSLSLAGLLHILIPVVEMTRVSQAWKFHHDLTPVAMQTSLRHANRTQMPILSQYAPEV